MTHPFHPLRERERDLVVYRHNWGEDRVYFHDEQGRLRSVPAAWTSLVASDPIVVLGAGRSPFRVADLLQLVALLGKIER